MKNESLVFAIKRWLRQVEGSPDFARRLFVCEARDDFMAMALARAFPEETIEDLLEAGRLLDQGAAREIGK